MPSAPEKHHMTQAYQYFSFGVLTPACFPLPSPNASTHGNKAVVPVDLAPTKFVPRIVHNSSGLEILLYNASSVTYLGDSLIEYK